jgi:hypothetical protein
MGTAENVPECKKNRTFPISAGAGDDPLSGLPDIQAISEVCIIHDFLI